MLSLDQILSEMTSEYKQLSGIIPLKTSDVYIKFKTLASQIFSLYSKLEWTKNQVFPQTASGKFLDYHAQTRGLTRKKATPSTGVLAFSISSPAKSNIIIPAKTTCFSSLNPDIKFATTAQAIIKQGDTQVDVTAKSIVTGSITNIGLNIISSMCNPPQFIEHVTNKTSFNGGCDEEPDDDLRERLLNSFKNISNGCNSAYYHNIVMNYDGVSSANVIPRNRGRGTVDIVIMTNKPIKGLLEKIQAEIQNQKEINVDVLVLPAKPKKINITLELDVDSAYNFEFIADKVADVVKQFMANMKVYEPLKLASLGAKIFNIAGVKNYKFNEPMRDLFINKDEIICLDQIKISKFN